MTETWKKFFTAKEVREAELIPRWHGLAWTKWETRTYIVFPIPFNLAVRLGRAFYHFLIQGPRGHVCVSDYGKGYREGYNEGMTDGIAKEGQRISAGFNSLYKERFGHDMS